MKYMVDIWMCSRNHMSKAMRQRARQCWKIVNRILKLKTRLEFSIFSRFPPCEKTKRIYQSWFFGPQLLQGHPCPVKSTAVPSIPTFIKDQDYYFFLFKFFWINWERDCYGLKFLRYLLTCNFTINKRKWLTSTTTSEIIWRCKYYTRYSAVYLD